MTGPKRQHFTLSLILDGFLHSISIQGSLIENGKKTP